MEKEKEKSCDLLMPTLQSSVAEEITRFIEYSRKFKENTKKTSFSPIAKYNREKKEKERKLSPFPFASKGMQNINVQKFEPLHIDNSAKSRGKLSSFPMSKDYAGASVESDVEEEKYPQRIPFCFDESDKIGMARTREYLEKVAIITEKKLKAIRKSPAYLKMKETLENTYSEKIMIINKDQKDKEPEDIHKDRKEKKLEDIQVMKNEISRKCQSQCHFTILSLSFLPVFLFLLYFGFSHI
ncbi:uncharacterized protein LOC109609720 isoform X2 [Camponotus floridanus]|nr:uncharacterized protein LOC109609720 isoform X2 [Camponotus floridanus]XP_025264546.1 uncharacterized protein LOC109609720 isoform X2 [Camponotus floridanus]